jgi:predicted transposase YbfD/YdcC
MSLSAEFLSYFSEVEDPRVPDRNLRHKLEDMFAIAILAAICGADNWVEISNFAESKEEWLRGFLELPNGIPSHDTFGRLFALLDADAFERCFSEWAHSLPVLMEGAIRREIIAVDGKTSRGSHNRRKGQNPLHLVSAWAVEQGLVLGQVGTEEKSNEIEAIPRLLNMIAIENSIVTIDAMGCQKAIARQIREQKADYILALKDNHPSLSWLVQYAIKTAESKTFEGTPYLRQLEKVRGEHGRIETRRYTLLSCDGHLLTKAKWPGLQSIGMLEVKRTVNYETTRSVRYFVTSLSYRQMKDFMRGARRHWNIEINLHWSLDVSFDDDRNRARCGHAQENLSIIKRIALNMLTHENSTNIGIKAKRKKAGWDLQYLKKIIQS